MKVILEMLDIYGHDGAVSNVSYTMLFHIKSVYRDKECCCFR